MKQINIANTSRQTMQLGFGCAYLLPETARLLDVAYDAGIQHFDVARGYGRGLTEGVLGKFLQRRGANVTITSKYGIRPAFNASFLGPVRSLLRPIVRKLRKVSSVDQPLSNFVKNDKAAFTAEEAEASLHQSLRYLRRDHIELFLMHEATADDLRDEKLLAFLDRSVASGKIGAFGVGGDAENARRLFQERPDYCCVMQLNWTVFDDPMLHADTFYCRYQVSSKNHPRIQTLLDAPEKQLAQWSAFIDDDLAAPGRLQQLLLKAALEQRPNDLILFSSTQPEHIIANVRTAEDTTLARPALKLLEVLQGEAMPA